MATAGVKLDDGTGGFASNCFPVRTLFGQNDEAAGAWLVAYRAEQRKRFKAILCTRPKTFSQIREERKKSEREHKTEERLPQPQDVERGQESPLLDGFFLLRHCCVEDPTDLCSINISGQEISDAKEDDFEMFDNVAYINAAENYLSLEAFHRFPILRELEIPLNGLRGLTLEPGHFPYLEMLDLSYNNLSQEDILSVGLLQHLKILQLSGNNLKSLPIDMTLPYRGDKGKFHRYPRLEVLMLDDNKLSDISIFACLAGLRCLRQLNLEKNDIYFVPQLTVLDGRVKTSNENFGSTRTPRKSGRRSSRQTQTEKLEELMLQRRQNTPRAESANQEPEAAVGLPEEQPHHGNVTPDVQVAVTELSDAPGQATPDAQEAIKTIPETIPEEKGEEELLYDKFDTADLSARISDLDLDREIQAATDDGVKDTSVTPYEEPVGPPPPPFSELRYLNLAYNQICNEEALLAVAAWPMLSELVIHNNPLTDEHPGDPPLLKRFLTDRLGINLMRKKPVPPGKRHIEVSTKKSRKVKSIVPKIPRVSVEERLMLEAPPTERRAQSCNDMPDKQKPLPPITPTPEPRAASAHGSSLSTPGSKVKGQTPEPLSDAWAEEGEDVPADSPIFMTQVDDHEEAGKVVAETPTAKERQLEKLRQDGRYKGYEDLLDMDSDSEYDAPNDISGNIRALKYALGHQLVYRDVVPQLDRVSKHVKAYNRTGTQHKPARMKQDKIDDALNNLKTRQTVEEADLAKVLKNKKTLKKKFPDADILLEEIQRRYNMVRVASMKEAKNPTDIVNEALNEVQGKLSGMSRVRRKGTETKVAK